MSVASVDGLRASTHHSFNVAAPGGIVTPRAPVKSESQERTTMALTPMQRRGEVTDIANAPVFFLSALSGYLPARRSRWRQLT